MNIVEFLVNWGRAVAPIKDEDASKLHNELDAKYMKIVTDPTHEGYVPSIKARVLHFLRQPEARLIMLISFAFVVKWTRRAMLANDDDDDQEDRRQRGFMDR